MVGIVVGVGLGLVMVVVVDEWVIVVDVDDEMRMMIYPPSHYDVVQTFSTSMVHGDDDGWVIVVVLGLGQFWRC